ncbi:MAG: hypothetical protein IIC10_02355 [Proteobacteria bacterium]|nr:hypothetical protein [Pseudomonadota bacterium]
MIGNKIYGVAEIRQRAGNTFAVFIAELPFVVFHHLQQHLQLQQAFGNEIRKIVVHSHIDNLVSGPFDFGRTLAASGGGSGFVYY